MYSDIFLHCILCLHYIFRPHLFVLNFLYLPMPPFHIFLASLPFFFGKLLLSFPPPKRVLFMYSSGVPIGNYVSNYYRRALLL